MHVHATMQSPVGIIQSSEQSAWALRYMNDQHMVCCDDALLLQFFGVVPAEKEEKEQDRCLRPEQCAGVIQGCCIFQGGDVYYSSRACS